MPGTIADEVEFLGRALQREGSAFADHLRTKGFSSEWFLARWSAVTAVINRERLGPKVLDLGCGAGWSSCFLAGRGFRVVAGDVAPGMLEIARANAARLGLAIDFRLINMSEPLDLDDAFDLVLILDALHHCPDEGRVLAHCYQVLRPGGAILLVEPDWFHAYSPGSSRARRAYGTTERGMGFRRMKRALKASGFERIRRVYAVHQTCGSRMGDRLWAMVGAGMTLTIGWPHRSVIALAVRPEAEAATP